MRAAKSKTDSTQERRSLQSSGTNAQVVLKRNEYSACYRKSLIISDHNVRQKTGQMPLKNTAACDRAEQMHDPDPKTKRFCYLLSQEPNILGPLRQKTGHMPLKNAAEAERWVVGKIARKRDRLTSPECEE